MSRFQKLSQSIWCCQYHIVWVPKISVSDSPRGSGYRRGRVYSDLYRTAEMYDSRVEYTTRSRTFASTDPTQDFGIKLRGDSQRANGHQDFESVPQTAAKTILGQSFLGSRLLCGYRGTG